MSDREPVSPQEFAALKQQVNRIGCIVYLLLAIAILGTLANNFPPLQSALDELFDSKYLVLGVGVVLIGLLAAANRLNSKADNK